VETRELKQTFRLKPHEKQELSLTVADPPSLLTISTRELEEGIPGRLKILLRARDPFSYALSKREEVLLSTPGEYLLVVENPEDFEQSIEVTLCLRRVRVLRETKYILEEKLGRRTFLISSGGKKYVYKNLPSHDEDRREVLRSLVLWSQLDHENIPKLVEVNLAEGFYIAEYAEGVNLEDLDRRLREEKVGSKEHVRLILEITRKALDILEYSYTQHIVHGDLKPSNIVYHEDEKQVYIIDWETCRQANEPISVRSPLSPPEVVKNGVCSDKSDIYSLGATLSWLLGWSGDKFTQWDTQRKAPRTIRELKQEALDNLSELIRKMTAHDPAERPTPSEAAKLVDKAIKSL
jgi:serine/threonine protein kinase